MDPDKLRVFRAKHGPAAMKEFFITKSRGYPPEYGDVLPWGCDSELGVAHLFTVKNESNITSAANGKLEVVIPLDALLYGIQVECILSTGARTLDFGLQISDSLTSDDWYQTLGAQGDGEFVPAMLICGSSGLPFEWPAPRIVRENNTLKVRVEPPTGITIAYFAITFLGRRLRGIEFDYYKCLDPRASGYIAYVLNPLALTWQAQGEEGPEKGEGNSINNRPFDVLVSRRSNIITLRTDAGKYTHLGGALAAVGITNTTFKHEHQTELIPTSFFGGGHFSEAVSPEATTRIPASPEGACWRASRLSSIKQTAAFLRRPTGSGDTEFFLKTVFHGMRVPPESLPNYLFTARAGYEGIPCSTLEEQGANIYTHGNRRSPGLHWGRHR